MSASIPGLADYNIPIYNGSGETIPPFGVVEIKGSDPWKADHNGRDYVVVTKPKPTDDEDATGLLLFNGPFPVPNAKPGKATIGFGALVKYGGSEAPKAGETWKAKQDTFTIEKEGEVGSTNIIGDVKTTKKLVRVAPLGGGGSGKATIEGACAFIKGTVPAASALDASGNLTTGATEENLLGKTVMQYGVLNAEFTADGKGLEAGALLVTPGTPADSTPGEGTTAPTKAVCFIVDGSNPPDIRPRIVGVLNPSLTPFVGEGPGVPVNGALLTIGEGETATGYFLIPTAEIRTRPEFVLGTNPTLHSSTIYRRGGERNERAGRNAC